MNAPEFDRNLQRSGDSARGPLDRVNGWGTQYVPGGARVFWIVVGLLLVALVVWAVWPSSNAKMAGGPFGAGGPVPVGVARANLGSVKVVLNALGAVTPLATVTVKPQVSGILTKIDFTEGEMVKAGALLAEIDPRPYQAALDQAKGTLAHDQAQLDNARVDLDRYQNLFKQTAISQQTLATQAALVRTDAGTVVADKAAMETAALNLAYCRITSPVPGRVGIRQVDVGNLMQPGVTTAIVIVTELQPISVLFTLPEDNISSVMERVGTGAKLEADAFDRANTVRLASGSLAALDNEVNSTTGTVQLRAMFDNADLRLFPQEFVNIHLLVNTLQNRTTIPVAAVQRGSDSSFVYAISGNLKGCSGDHIVTTCAASVRNVVIGTQDGDKVDVTSGLEPGDIVVTDGADRLKDGAKVTIPTPVKFTPGRHGSHGGHGHHHRSQGGDGSGGGQ
ncbi:MAG: efflux RND transporter periplasmic adaptor subunit [Rhizomicrobium sp.]|jgi:multidrug efflux system membrane fusion protein